MVCCGNGALSGGVFFLIVMILWQLRLEFLVMALTGWQGGRRQELWWAVIGLCNKNFFFTSVYLCMHGFVLSLIATAYMSMGY